MPKRPRPHTIEDESRTSFRTLLPKEWVFRDSVPDYGIDGEVEIFDEKGNATGHFFKVQLKATDERVLKRALTVRLTKDKDQYYRSLDLPTLIVRYHAPSRKLYARWFHTFDPYYGSKGKKTISFRLSDDDEWNNETASKLVTELRLFRRLISSDLPLPIYFTLITRETIIHGIPALQITSALRRAAEELSGVIAFTSVSPKHAHPRIEIDSDKALIDLAGLKTATYHARGKYPKELAATRFPFDVLLFIAVVLARAGHISTAARIVLQYADRSDVVRNPTIAIELTACLARAQKITEALQLSDKLLTVEGSELSSQILAFAPYIKSELLSKGQSDELLQFLERRVEHAEKVEKGRSVATAHYNLGSMLRDSSYRRAIHHYRKAAEYDPDYLERQYLWRELGALLFQSRRYSLASLFYKRALAKGEENECRVLYADALMFAGKYNESEESFQFYLGSRISANDSWTPEWRLKILVLKEIRTKLGVDEQKRRPNAAVKLLLQAPRSFTDEQMPVVEAALKLDALCLIAWGDLVRIHLAANRPLDAFLPSLAVALIRRTDSDAWCWSILLALCSPENQSTATDIIATAYMVNGEAFVDGAVKFSKNLPQDFPKDEFPKVVNEIVSQVSKISPPTVIRVLGEGANYKVIPLGSSGLGAPN